MNHGELIKKLGEEMEGLRDETVSLIRTAGKRFIQPYNYQRRQLVDQGFVEINGLIIPEKAIGYRVMYDHLEASLLEAYLKLQDQVAKNVDNPLTSFAARAFIDFAYTVAPALFSGVVPPKLLTRYKAMLVLKDYLAISSGEGKYYEFYVQLKDSVKNDLKLRDLQELTKEEQNDNTGFGSVGNYIEATIKKDIQRKLDSLGELTPKQGQFKGKLYKYYSELIHAGSPIIVGAELDHPSGMRKRLLLLDASLAVAKVLAMNPKVSDDKEWVASLDKLEAQIVNLYKHLNYAWKARPSRGGEM